MPNLTLQFADSGELAGGTNKGPLRADAAQLTTSIDIGRRSDAAMIMRALAAGWTIDESLRRAACQQLPAALELAQTERERLRLAKLAIALDRADFLHDKPDLLQMAESNAPRRPGRRAARAAFRQRERQRLREARERATS